MTTWAASFIAMSVALGEPLDAAVAALGEEATGEALALATALRAAKSARARATRVARVLAEVAREVDGAGIA
jgi:hypothetical protein